MLGSAAMNNLFEFERACRVRLFSCPVMAMRASFLEENFPFVFMANVVRKRGGMSSATMKPVN